MTTIAAPADKRFRRVHVKPARRRRSWQALVRPAGTWLVLVSLLAFGVYRTTSIAAHAGALRIDRIAVRGNDRLSKDEVLAILNGLRGQNVLWTNLDAWRIKLMASPWVRDASLRRSLPSTVDVVIAERNPIGVGRINGAMYLIDERGVVIDQYGPQYSNLDLPIIDGLSRHAGREPHRDTDSAVDAARADLAARVIAAFSAKPALARRLSQVDVTDVRNAKVILNGDTAVIHLGEDQFLSRIESYLDLATALRDRVADIDYVDLRFDDRIYVRPAATAKTPRRATAGSGNQATDKR
jgi:cell division protein FtsQ